MLEFRFAVFDLLVQKACFKAKETKFIRTVTAYLKNPNSASSGNWKHTSNTLNQRQNTKKKSQRRPYATKLNHS